METCLICDKPKCSECDDFIYGAFVVYNPVLYQYKHDAIGPLCKKCYTKLTTLKLIYEGVETE